MAKPGQAILDTIDRLSHELSPQEAIDAASKLTDTPAKDAVAMAEDADDEDSADKASTDEAQAEEQAPAPDPSEAPPGDDGDPTEAATTTPGPATPQAAAADEAATNAALSSPAGMLKAKSTLDQDIYDQGVNAAQADEGIRAIDEHKRLAIEEAKLKSLNDYAEGMQQLNVDNQQKIDGQMAHYRQAVDTLRNTNPNPYADHGTAYNIASALFIGMNQLGVQIGGKNAPNLAYQMIQDAHARDLQAAQYQLENAKGGVMREGQLLERMQGVFQNKRAALQAAKTALMEHTVAEAERQASQNNWQKNDLNSQKTVALLKAKLDENHKKTLDEAVKQNHSEYTENATELHRRNMENIARLSLKMKVQENEQKTADKKEKADDKEDTETSKRLELERGAPQAVTAASKALVNGNTAMAVLDDYKDLDDVPPHKVSLFIDEIAKMAKGGGAATESDKHALEIPTMKRKMAELEQKMGDKPVGAKQGAFIKDYAEYLEGMRKTYRSTINDHRKGVLSPKMEKLSDKTKQRYIGRYPDLESWIEQGGDVPAKKADAK